MKATLAVLNELERQGIVHRYAIGGAMAAMFYVEPTVTYDMHIFVVLPTSSGLLTLTPIYDALRQRGYEPEGECIVIEGVPVQFLPAYNPLVEEALEQARLVDVEGVATRVLPLEHLIAMAAQTGRLKDRARVQLLMDEGSVNTVRLADICGRHGLSVPSQEETP
ncbi:MAG: hypothetical protein M0Z54_13100 [Thermaerobacter sp.]|nr:hypothetical protein [Thermaerobacter sp.]